MQTPDPKKSHWHGTYQNARRIAVALVGGTVLLIGVALLVLPGPAFIVIPVGLAILGLEFAWARHWLTQIKARVAAASRGYAGQSRETRR